MTAAATDWLDAANILAGILQAENDALAAIDFSAAAALLPAKRTAMAAIDAHPPKGPKPALRAAVQRLDQLAAENRRQLRNSIGIQSQVLGIIANAARTASTHGYGSSGRSSFTASPFALSARA